MQINLTVRRNIMKKARAAILFYGNYCIAPIVLSAVFCIRYKMAGGSMPVALCSKLLADIAVWYFIVGLSPERLYYYYNLHISKAELAASFFFIDLSLLAIGLWITRLM